MAGTALIQAEVDVEVVEKASAMLAERGMNMSEAVGMLLERFVREESEAIQGEDDPEYDAWFRARVQEALDDPRPGIPHEVVMQEWAKQRAELLERAAGGKVIVAP